MRRVPKSRDSVLPIEGILTVGVLVHEIQERERHTLLIRHGVAKRGQQRGEIPGPGPETESRCGIPGPVLARDPLGEDDGRFERGRSKPTPWISR
jgi:hypothetical protein